MRVFVARIFLFLLELVAMMQRFLSTAMWQIIWFRVSHIVNTFCVYARVSLRCGVVCCGSKVRQGRLRSWQSVGTALVVAGIVVSGFTLCGGIGCPAVDPLSVFGTAMVMLAVVCELVGGLARIELLKAQRVDVVKLNAWTALFQLLVRVNISALQ